MFLQRFFGEMIKGKGGKEGRSVFWILFYYLCFFFCRDMLVSPGQNR